MTKQRIAFSFLLAFSTCCSLFLSLFVSLTEARAADRIPGEFLVRYKDNAVIATASVRSIAGVRLASHNPFARILKVQVQLHDEAGAVARLLKDPNVKYVVPNIRLRSFTQSVEISALKDQWALKKVRAQEAWNRAGNQGSRKVVVGVIDTGVDSKHANLAQNMIPGYNFKDNNEDAYDKTKPGGNPGHGTHCAGIVGATGLIDDGIVGMSPEVSIMPIRFLDENGSGDLNNGIKAIDYAIQKKVDVISASWGAAVPRNQAMPLIEAVKRADDAGIPFVAAAANDGKNNDKVDVFPTNAGFPNMIAVAASGPNDEKPSWSNYGKRTVHVAAPGLDIMSTLPGNKYGKLSGTSMATPLVAGLVAFLKSQDSTLTGAETRALLQLTGSKVGIETACNCRVDAMSAVETVLNRKMFVVPAAASLKVGSTLQFGAKYGNGSLRFSVADSTVGSITDSGLFKAAKAGTTTVTVTDGSGQSSQSLEIIVDNSGGGGGDNGGGFPPPGGGDDGGGLPQPPGGGGPGDGSCPVGDQQVCDILCQINPNQPFCKK